MTTKEEQKMFRRYVYVFWLTFPILLIFGLAFFMRRVTAPLPGKLEYAILWPFGIATAATNIFYNYTAAIFIFRERTPVRSPFFSSRMGAYYDSGRFPKIRRHLCRMIQSFDPDHFTHMDDL